VLTGTFFFAAATHLTNVQPGFTTYRNNATFHSIPQSVLWNTVVA